MELSYVKSNNDNKRERSNEEIFLLNEVRSDADRLLCSEITPRTNTQSHTTLSFDGERLNATIKHFNAFHLRCSFPLIGNGKNFSITFHARWKLSLRFIFWVEFYSKIVALNWFNIHRTHYYFQKDWQVSTGSWNSVGDVEILAPYFSDQKKGGRRSIEGRSKAVVSIKRPSIFTLFDRYIQYWYSL